MGKTSTLPPEIETEVNLWLNGQFDEKTKNSIQELKQNNPEKLVDAFYKRLEFGTGGMRGLMGPGTNRVNIYTIRAAALGLARYIKKSETNNPSIVISYDSRLHSEEFAKEAARVFAEQEVKVFLFEELRPVPLVSFAVRHTKATAGIMITASHNPPEYNGFKVYWSDGSQVLPPHDKGIVEEVAKIQEFDKVALSPLENPIISRLGEEIDEAYLNAVSALQSTPEVNQEKGEELEIIYTPLHGAGITMVPKTLAMWGFINQDIVLEQSTPDGNFPTVVAPNPEIPSTLKLGIQKMLKQKADILLATDADSDRVGCVVNCSGDVHILSGNEIAAICLEHLLENGTVNEKTCVVKSIVTTELLRAISTYWKVDCIDVLTGFKYIGQKMTEWESSKEKEFLFGCEESFGYLLGTYARDKDAVIACALLAEVALNAKLKGETLVDRLHSLYKKYGVFRSHLRSVNFEESRAGREAMDQAMKRLREEPPTEILGHKIIRMDDFKSSEQKILETGEVTPLPFPKSNVLVFYFEGGSKLTIRPSGTEPKVKLYIEVRDDKDSPVDLGIEHCDVLGKNFLDTVKTLLES